MTKSLQGLISAYIDWGELIKQKNILQKVIKLMKTQYQHGI